MNLYASYEDKDTIIHRLQTHISILQQQNQSQGYFSYDETPTIHNELSTQNNSNDDVETLEKLLQKREYELHEIREKLNETQNESEEKLRRTVQELNTLEKKFAAVVSERNELREKLQKVQDENDLMKSYLNHLPSEVEFEKLKQSHRILEEKLKASNEMLNDYRREKIQIRKQINVYQEKLEEQEKTIKNFPKIDESSMFAAKGLTMDERKATEKQIEQFRTMIEELNGKLNEEKRWRKQQENLQEKNEKTLETFSSELMKKDEKIQELKNFLRQTRQELDELRVRLVFSEEEQTRLNKRLLNNEEFSSTLQRVQRIVEKFLLVLDFSLEIINNQSATSPDILMLQFSSHKSKSDSTNDEEKLIDVSEIEKLESKLDLIVDRLLSMRSEFIARQFENELESKDSCRLQ